MSARILIGDCRLRMKELPDNSVDSVVCDPPYHLTTQTKRDLNTIAAPQFRRAMAGFMGQKWDGGDIAQDPAMWAEVLRVLKPGGFLAAFGGTRTYHRMAVAIEDAGFEVKDCIFYCYGSGFPKSHNVGKALDAKEKRCSCSKDLHGLRDRLDSGQPLPSGSEQDLRESLHGSAHFGTEDWSVQTGTGAMRHLREVGCSSPALETAQASDGEAVLQQTLLGPDASGAHEADRALGGKRTESAQRVTNGAQPGLEGRRDLLPTEGELHRPEICQGAQVGAADGAQGRLHNGASVSDGPDVRVSPDPNGSGQSQGPQSEEQRPAQLGTLPNECGSQEGGAWPLCRGCGKPIVPDGLGTALKPAVEPICLARKPLESTVAANVLKHGTGALNIDACRIDASDGELKSGTYERKHKGSIYNESTSGLTGSFEYDGSKGRWPANLCHDGSDEVLAGFPDLGATAASYTRGARAEGNWLHTKEAGTEQAGFGDSGSAARFFYCAKATSEERGEGNGHPTVKPIALMRWLCRLVTPKDGTVLDPFMGSGSTLIAADAEQFHAIGCELSPEYAAIAERRIRDAAGMFADVKVAA